MSPQPAFSADPEQCPQPREQGKRRGGSIPQPCSSAVYPTKCLPSRASSSPSHSIKLCVCVVNIESDSRQLFYFSLFASQLSAPHERKKGTGAWQSSGSICAQTQPSAFALRAHAFPCPLARPRSLALFAPSSLSSLFFFFSASNSSFPAFFNTI